jgi:hypothetical protein
VYPDADELVPSRVANIDQRSDQVRRYHVEGAQGREELPGVLGSGQLDSFAATTPVTVLM